MKVKFAGKDTEKLFIIDAVDYEWIKDRPVYYDRYATLSEYNKDSGRSSRIYLHREIGKLKFGDIDGKIIHHIDGNKLNNKRNNLELTDKLKNNILRPLQSNNTTGYRGVIRIRGKYRAKLSTKEKSFNFGDWQKASTAAFVYNHCVNKIFPGLYNEVFNKIDSRQEGTAITEIKEKLLSQKPAAFKKLLKDFD